MAKSSEKSSDKRLKNLKPYKKGESGNPDGKQIGTKNYSTLYKEALLKLAELKNEDPESLETELTQNAIEAAKKGDYRFYKDLMDRLYGTAVQNTDLTSDGEKLSIDVVYYGKEDDSS